MKVKSDPRHFARKLALSSIFCWLFSEQDQIGSSLLAKEQMGMDVDKTDLELAESISNGVKEHVSELDDVISKCAPEWPIDKISKIDLVILRISIYEILFSKNTPDKVAVDEAVELAKEFGNDTSSKFVNGVLGSVINYKENK
jgi:N utilization substance protein B